METEPLFKNVIACSLLNEKNRKSKTNPNAINTLKTVHHKKKGANAFSRLLLLS